MGSVSGRRQQWVVRGLVALMLLLPLQMAFWAKPATVGAARCGGCYNVVWWHGGTIGSWSGGSTTILVPRMVLDSNTAIMNNTLWIAGHINDTWVEAGVAVGAGTDDGLSIYGTEFYYAAQKNHEGLYRTRFLGIVPFNDIGAWAGVNIWSNFNGTWEPAIYSPSAGRWQYLRVAWRPNSMQANRQDIGLELANGNVAIGEPEAYADVAHFANNSWRRNDGVYIPQARMDDLGSPHADPPLAGGWLEYPTNGRGGLWYTFTR